MLGRFLLPSYVIVADKTFRTKINTYGTHERSSAAPHWQPKFYTHNVCYTRNKQRIGCEMVSLFFYYLGIYTKRSCYKHLTSTNSRFCFCTKSAKFTFALTLTTYCNILAKISIFQREVNLCLFL